MKGDLFLFEFPGLKTTLFDVSEKYIMNKLNPELYMTKTVLVVEDEDINFQLITMMLSKLGLNILRAVNGAVAVSVCHTAQPLDLVLMDVRMPVMDGYEATERIKKLRPDLPVIIQTAHSTIDDIAKAYASGCSDFIAKPFKRDEIIDKITEQLLKNKYSGN